MECPRCSSNLQLTKYKGIEVDKCDSCDGMWLDHQELDQLEDTVMDDDELKGSLITRSGVSELTCPRCQQPMQQFRYRYNELWLDACEAEHGFWLDKGEENRVLELMEQRKGNMKRSASAEQDWARMLSKVHSKSFFQKIKDSFKK